MLDDLVDRVFDGSAASVMLSLFDGALVDPDELKELRRLINQKVKEQSP
jgi:predicted transcriptional regulator